MLCREVQTNVHDYFARQVMQTRNLLWPGSRFSSFSSFFFNKCDLGAEGQKLTIFAKTVIIWPQSESDTQVQRVKKKI